MSIEIYTDPLVEDRRSQAVSYRVIGNGRIGADFQLNVSESILPLVQRWVMFYRPSYEYRNKKHGVVEIESLSFSTYI